MEMLIIKALAFKHRSLFLVFLSYATKSVSSEGPVSGSAVACDTATIFFLLSTGTGSEDLLEFLYLWLRYDLTVSYQDKNKLTMRIYIVDSTTQ